MKKILTMVMILSLSVMVAGCYYGKNEYWEGGFALNEETKKKDDGNLYFGYKKGKVNFDKIELKVKGKTIFSKENFNKKEFKVELKSTKNMTKKEKIEVHMKWKVKGKTYNETLVLEKQ